MPSLEDIVMVPIEIAESVIEAVLDALAGN